MLFQEFSCPNVTIGLRRGDFLHTNVFYNRVTCIFFKQPYHNQTSEDIARLNAAIIPLIKAKNIAINDLYGLVCPVKKEIIRNDDLFHLNEKGIELCSKQVIEAIKSRLSEVL